MKQKKQLKQVWIGVCLLAAFALWTVLVCTVDVAPIGPLGSSVGFSTINRFVHASTGVHLWLYSVTDWLGLVSIAIAVGFGALGLQQWIHRKSLLRVDRSLLLLGGFYLAVMAAFVSFEVVAINYRPILIEGRLEASYPSSTTMLVMCVMPTAILQWNARIKKGAIRRTVMYIAMIFTAFMVVGRLFSGVHWISDIIGGVLLSAALVMLYRGIALSNRI